jgi:hydroxymethylbilane synthase
MNPSSVSDSSSFRPQPSAFILHPSSLRIGTRGSVLARWQADWVEQALRRASPNNTFVQVIVKTTGDIMPDKPLGHLGGRGAFTRELDAALLDGRIDLAVHSAKDYPTDVPKDLIVAAFPCRWPVNDSLVGRHGERLRDLSPGALIGTGSLRRSAQIRAIRPDVRFGEIRGNIETRLRKLDEGQYDAVVIAEAALRRLGLTDRPREMLPITRLVPDAGQGALMVVCRRNDRRVRRVTARINDSRVAACVAAERAVLSGLGGGCRLPLGVYARIVGATMSLRAVVISPDGTQKIALRMKCSARKGLRAARQAVRHLQDRGAREILDQVESELNHE